MTGSEVRMFTSSKRAILLMGATLLGPAMPRAVVAQIQYSVTDIAPLNDLSDETPGAASVNNAGLVVGRALLPNGPDRPFLWINGNIFDLGTFGGPNGGARSINARGQIAGKADTAAGSEHAFLWNEGVLHDLGTLGGDNSEGNGNNARGWTVGFSATTIPDPTGTTGPYESHAFLLTALGEPLQDLGTLGGPNSIAISINDGGVIVGWSQVDFNIGAFGIPDLHAAMWVNGVPKPLPGFGGSVTLALSVNNSGTAVGQSFLADDSTLYAVMWNNGELIPLGAVSDDIASGANSINNRGDVVGFSITTSFASRAFLRRNGVMTDLNTLIPANDGWVLMSAEHINDEGQIVGYGFLNGDLHAFLLTPNSGGGRTGSSTTSPATVQISNMMLRSLIWGKSGLLKRRPTWIR